MNVFGPTRSTNTAVLHHLVVLDNPFLEEFFTKAKLTYLLAVSSSWDPLKEKTASLALSPHTNSALASPEVAKQMFWVWQMIRWNLSTENHCQRLWNVFWMSDLQRNGIDTLMHFQFSTNPGRPACEFRDALALPFHFSTNSERPSCEFLDALSLRCYIPFWKYLRKWRLWGTFHLLSQIGSHSGGIGYSTTQQN